MAIFNSYVKFREGIPNDEDDEGGQKPGTGWKQQK